MTLFLAGDVMTGRGVDQVLAHPSDPTQYEPSVKDARIYVGLAEEVHGAIPRAVSDAYIWGEALAALNAAAPDVRIVNLETAVTTCDRCDPDKGIHYRTHPANVGCLTAAALDCCCLGNNHVLDWGRAGLIETLETLQAAGIRTAGAGRNLEEAQQPARMSLQGGGRVLVFAAGSPTAGVPRRWAATATEPGVHHIDESAPEAASNLADLIRRSAEPGDVIVVSIHWGPNWGYKIPAVQRKLAHHLIDEAGVHVVHGHSSHHVKGIEVYRDRLILYGCGDLLTDYEGISGYEAFRGDLGLMYIVTLDPEAGRLQKVRMIPTQMQRLQLCLAAPEDAKWLEALLNREGARLGTHVEATADGILQLDWNRGM